MSVAKILEDIYTSLKNNNEGIDAHITALKIAMAQDGQKSVTVDPSKLAQNNRQGRKVMQAYFKKRGVAIEFAA